MKYKIIEFGIFKIFALVSSCRFYIIEFHIPFPILFCSPSVLLVAFLISIYFTLSKRQNMKYRPWPRIKKYL